MATVTDWFKSATRVLALLGATSLAQADVVLELDGDCTDPEGLFCYEFFEEIAFLPGDLRMVSRHQQRGDCVNVSSISGDAGFLDFDGTPIPLALTEIVYDLENRALLVTSNSLLGVRCEPPGDVVFRDDVDRILR